MERQTAYKGSTEQLSEKRMSTGSMAMVFWRQNLKSGSRSRGGSFPARRLQVLENMLLVVKIDGQVQQKSISEVYEKLSLLEDGMKTKTTQGF